MKFPSLQSLFSELKSVILRFPLEMMFAFAGTLAGITLIELNYLQAFAENICIRLLMVANLGLLLSFSISTLSEYRELARSQRLLLSLCAVVLCAIFFFLLNPLTREVDILRFILLSLGCHLLVSFAAFTGRNKIDEFWLFNKTLFLRFLTGVLYSGVLFLGLSAAIGSMNFLFGFKFEWDTFAILWTIIAGLFQTVFFLSGVPKVPDIKTNQEYPNALKAFTQYVLIPLASVYAVILLAYEVKIIVQWELPKGLVSSLILGYAVFGILSLLLVYPVKDRDENKWIKTYTRSFYYLMVPLLGLLIWAVLARVLDYGVTEERYFLIVLAGWLTFITCYFLFSDRQDIGLIPLSLYVVTLLSVYGPQGAFETSRRSQANELRQLFEKHGAYKANKLIPLKDGQAKEDVDRILNVIDYLVNQHGLTSFNKLLDKDLSPIVDSLQSPAGNEPHSARINQWEIRSKQRDWIYNYLNISTAGKNRYSVTPFSVVQAENTELIPLSGADYLLDITTYPDSNGVMIGRSRLTISRKNQEFKIRYKDETKFVSLDSIMKDLQASLDSGKTSGEGANYFPRKRLTQQADFKDISIQILWNRLTFNSSGDISYADGAMLIKRK